MKRRRAREYALQMLFQLDFTERDRHEKAMADFWSGKRADREIREFTDHLVKGTLDHLGEIDSMIESVAENWILERMAAVDRNILRFATYEIVYRKDIPTAVTINEALEIAKKYSTADAATFLNGILDRIAREAKRV